MNNNSTWRALRFAAIPVLAAAMALILGCGGRAPNFYLLAPSAELQPLNAAASGVVVDKIKIPDYLSRSQMIIREKNNRLILANSQRWAEPLAANATRVLMENLTALLPDCNVVDFNSRAPRDGMTVVSVTLTQFEGLDSGVAVLSAQWHVTKNSSGANSTTITGQSSHEESFKRRDYASLAAALSTLLARMSADIADAVAKP